MKQPLTHQDCMTTVAKKYDLGKTLVTGHRDKYWSEAAELYKSSHVEALEAEVEALRKEREWIPVGDRLPEDPNQLCIFGKWYPNWSRFINIESMLWSEFQAHRSWELKKSYTHWQHLAPNP